MFMTSSKSSIRQQGTALLSALMMVIVIASILTIWVYQTQFHIKKMHLALENQQAQWIANGAKSWAAVTLKKYRFKTTQPILATLSGKTIDLPKNWKLSAKLIDAQSRFNLNNLEEQPQRILFYLLLENLLKKEKNVPLEQIFYGTLAKLDPTFDQHQKNNHRSLNAPHQKIMDSYATLGQWLQIKGVNPQIYKVMAPFLTVLPDSLPLNINTCPKELIKALKPGLKDKDVERILFARGDKGFRSQDELFAILETFKIPVQNVTIFSQYFWVEVDITTPTHRHIQTEYLFVRKLSKKETPIISLIQQFNLL
jgi:general secretion pathway protein K